MKKLKTLKYLGLLFASLLVTVSCTEVDVDETLKIDHTGGYLDVLSSSLSYVVGNDAAYPIDLVASNGKNPITKIEVFNTYSTSTGEKSNTVLAKTIDVASSEGLKQALNFSVTFEDLIQGIVIDGAPLSDDDTLLNIGDGFTLSYIAHVASGDSSKSAAKTKLTVSTRFAGNYKIIEGTYWRIGVLTYETADFPTQVTIESVDATTYRMLDWFGAFNTVTDDGGWYFQVQSDLTITYPLPQAPTDAAWPMRTCSEDLAKFDNADCSMYNYIVLDDVEGKDKMYMVYAYENVGSGMREFQVVYEKIVE